MNTNNTHTTFCAFSHTVADHIGVPHKVLKRHIREVLESMDRCLCEDGYHFKDAKGREKFGYMMDKELLVAVLAGFHVERLADELMEITVLEVEEVA